jgi:Domain of unknown function (DUF4145)
MTDQAVPKKRRVYCNTCKQETNHEPKGEHKAMWSENGFDETLIYRLLVCMGCEHGVLEQEYSNSEMFYWDDANEDDAKAVEFSDVAYFPERSQNNLAPKPYAKLKPALAALYKEAITCYNQKSPILCAAGLRALLEGICQDKKIKGKNLQAKIEGLKSLLPNKNIIRNLHHLRFMGNEAVHELAAPKPTELTLAISLIEDLLNFLYELDYKASQLRELRRQKQIRPKKPAKAVSATLTITPRP